ncbi:MAG: hypothetical protein R2755_21585 [Acidimicrobiales bacterium]
MPHPLLQRALHGATRPLGIAVFAALLASAGAGGAVLAHRSGGDAVIGGVAVRRERVAPEHTPLGARWQAASLDPAAPIPLSPAAPAPDPMDAVMRFVAAEAGRDADAAWSLLSAADRERYPTPAMWRTEHRQLPWLTATTLDPAPKADTGSVPIGTAAPTEAVLTGTASFEPALDLTKGLVPDDAAATWVVVAEDGGWRVAWNRSRFEPRLPDDAGAVPAAQAWGQARQECRSTDDAGRPLEPAGGVVGIAGLAERLCRATGAVRAGPAEPLAAADAAAVVAAFGGSALQWARVVPLDGPIPQRVVLGPLGERWIAIGVLPA